MSPAAVDRSDSTMNDNKLIRRSSIGYLPRESAIGRKSPGRSSPPEYNGARSPTKSPPILSLRSSSTSGEQNLHTPPKRIRPSSLYSPPPTLTKFLKPHFERSFHEWIGFHDQNSRDSGFESTASTSSSSHRSTPVDHNDAAEASASVSSSSASSAPLKRQCQWDDCPNPDLDEGDELLDHILSAHVQPLETLDTNRSKCLEKFACRWKDCKVYCKPSRLYAWLERHVVEKHAGPRPYGCPVPGCRQRFSGRSAAERHINSHFENSTDVVAVGSGASLSSTTIVNTTASPKNKNLHRPAAATTTNGRGSKKSTTTITTVISTSNNDDDLSPAADGGGVQAENTCKILASTSTTNNKKRNHAPKSNLSSDPLDDKFVRDSLAWRLSLAMTNERLASSTSGCSPCRKRNSGINHNQQQQLLHKRQRDSSDDITTFQCKVLARRRRNEDCVEDEDDDCEFLVDWSPSGYLPWVWMPKKMYKNSFTVANGFVSRVCFSSSTNHN